jgi:predicted DNA-binding WGR domain protein
LNNPLLGPEESYSVEQDQEKNSNKFKIISSKKQKHLINYGKSN